MSYHLCARQIGQCVGLGRGIKEYHLCARNANCKKKDREKVEKVVSKIKGREKDKAVKRIDKFFYETQARPAILEIMISNIYEYQRHMESANKPRIRKKTKDYWLEEARKAKEKVFLKSAWMKKNFPNADINDPTLPNQLRRAEKKLIKNKEDVKDRTYTRNFRTSKIREMIDDYNKDKAKGNRKEAQERKNLRVVDNYIREYEKIYNQKLKELGVTYIDTPRYCNFKGTSRLNCQTLLNFTIGRLNLFSDGIIPENGFYVWLEHMDRLKKRKKL